MSRRWLLLVHSFRGNIVTASSSAEMVGCPTRSATWALELGVVRQS
jgi:hypothetical protein